MMVTEEEAMAKWCPHARVSAYIPGADHSIALNRAHPDGEMNIERACCIASACMAWRRGKPIVSMQSGRYEPVEQKGYCGLSGKPE